jgi:hypothetical protein
VPNQLRPRRPDASCARERNPARPGDSIELGCRQSSYRHAEAPRSASSLRPRCPSLRPGKFSTKVEKKRWRSAFVDLSRDPQRRFDCYQQPPKTSIPPSRASCKTASALDDCARCALVGNFGAAHLKFSAGRRRKYPYRKSPCSRV